MENAGPTNRHRLILLDPRQATHLAIDRTRGVALPSVDTVDRHTADVDHINDAVLQRYGVTATVPMQPISRRPARRNRRTRARA